MKFIIRWAVLVIELILGFSILPTRAAINLESNATAQHITGRQLHVIVTNFARPFLRAWDGNSIAFGQPIGGMIVRQKFKSFAGFSKKFLKKCKP